MIQEKNGDFIFVASTESNNGEINANHGANDIWAVSLRPNGAIEWQKCLGGSGNDLAEEIIQTRDGGYAILGITTSSNGDVTNHSTIFNLLHGNSYEDSLDIWLIKVDNNFNVQWQQCYGGFTYDIGYCVIQTNDRGFVIAGSTDNNFEGWFNHGGIDALVIKIDSLGREQWHKLFGGSSQDNAASIIATEDGGYIFTGNTLSNDGDVTGFHGDPKNGQTDLWVVKIDSLGNINWQKTYGGSYSDYGFKIIASDSNGYLVIGGANSSDGDVIGHHPGGNPKDPLGPHNTDAWILNLDSIGNIRWQKCYGGSNGDEANTIIRLNNGHYI